MKKFLLCLCLLLVACGGEGEKEQIEIYDIIGIWEVTPTINCSEYDCYGESCSEADIPQKYSMTVEKSGDDLLAIFHYGGVVDGPYVLKNKINNTYTLYEFDDYEFYIEIYEFIITLSSDDLFTGSESWRHIADDGHCQEVNSLIGEKVY